VEVAVAAAAVAAEAAVAAAAVTEAAAHRGAAAVIVEWIQFLAHRQMKEIGPSDRDRTWSVHPPHSGLEVKVMMANANQAPPFGLT
jgi:hypothetical protein